MTGVKLTTVTSRDNRKLALRMAGDPQKTPIILLHGQMHSGLCWEGVLRSRLGQEAFMIAPDMAGHGGSDAMPRGDKKYLAEDIADIVAHFRIDSPVVVAWSFGSVVACDTIRSGLSVSKLMLVGIGSQSPGIAAEGASDLHVALTKYIDQVEASGADLPFGLRLFRSLISSDDSEKISAVEQMVDVCRRNPLPSSHRSALIGEAHRIACDTRASIFAHAYDNRDILAAFGGMILQIHGEQDRLRPVATAHERQGLFKDGVTEVWPDSGHAPFDDEPDRFVSTLSAFARA